MPGSSFHLLRCCSGLAFTCLLAAPLLHADEGGSSFWLPGQFGSLAATQVAPGWSLPVMFYHYDGNASSGKQFDIAGNLSLGLNARADLMFLVPTYTFSEPLLGAQAAVSMASLYGRMQVDVQATLATPGGRVLSGTRSDSLTSVGDLYPSGSLRWNFGNHNLMTYGMLGVPVGSYEEGRLANIGSNHWSADAGGGYTYLNQTGQELSLTAGYTHNWENHDTDYRNGDSLHLDWGASQFVSEHWHVGLVGYFYQQITADSGSGAVLGDFESRVAGAGPQIGYLFDIGGKDAYINLKGYQEFDAKHRPEGWSAWLTLALPLGTLSN